MELLESLLDTLTSVSKPNVEKEFSEVRLQVALMQKEAGLTCEVGARKENVKKNRYKDIMPYDQSRVVLSLLTSDLDSDYINASFIKGATAGKGYIACQAPLSSTLTDLWRMIWQHDVKVIVMACREVELGKTKCECYWAPVEQSVSFGPFTIKNQRETRPNNDLIIRALTVTLHQECRCVLHYQFLSWPDHDVPHETEGVLDLLDRVRGSRGTHTSPLLVHCSAGCGRTGVICALDYIHDLVVAKQVTADFSIRKVVLELRRQRPSAVQTKGQYHFLFRAAACVLQRFLQSASQQLQPTPPQRKSERKKKPGSPSKRLVLHMSMNDTYAVVNKAKHPGPASPSSCHSPVPPPKPTTTGSRTLPASHHYGNDPGGLAAAPLYSIVKPRARPISTPPPATPIYDTAVPANPPAPPAQPQYQLVSAERRSSTDDDDYEDVNASTAHLRTSCSRDGLGFNCRIQKPRGPRDPPAEWGRLER